MEEHISLLMLQWVLSQQDTDEELLSAAGTQKRNHTMVYGEVEVVATYHEEMLYDYSSMKQDTVMSQAGQDDVVVEVVASRMAWV